MDFERARGEMLRLDIARRGVKDKRVLAAMGRVSREKFVGPVDLDEAYADHPLGIGCGQTISQPYIVAAMTEMLELTGSERVLEIGTGSGYQTAVLAELAAEVFTVERHAELSERARGVLSALGYDNVRFRAGDGSVGWPEEAPFDAIMVTAAAPQVPESLQAALADGGRLVAPVGGPAAQRLVTVRRKGERFKTITGLDCIFVRLIGEQGFKE